MAERRMFSKQIIDSDAFLDMPLSTQALYFHLAMRADDEGFVNNPKKVQRMIAASDDDLRVLIAKNFIIPFASGIVVIKHWRIHNYIQNDRFHPTTYTEERAQLEVKSNSAYTLINQQDTKRIQDGYKMDTEVSLGEYSLNNNRLGDIEKPARSRFTPPTLEEVENYCKERNNGVDAKKFYDYYQEGKWHDSQGKPVRNWKQKLLRWEKDEAPKQAQAQRMAKRGPEREIIDDWDVSSIMNRPRSIGGQNGI